MSKTGTIYGINGPVIYLAGNTGFKMSEMVYVGKEKLVGEVISLDKDRTTIQVYEETSGLKPGEIVEASGEAVSVTLAPGILDNIFDGIERPLERIAENAGAFITRGISVDSLDMEKLWDTKLVVNEGDILHGGAPFDFAHHDDLGRRKQEPSYTNAWCRQILQERLPLWHLMENMRSRII